VPSIFRGEAGRAGACVTEGIAQGLAADPMDVVLDDRAKSARRAMDGDIKRGSFSVRIADRRGRELFAKRARGDGQIVGDERGSAQALNGILSLPDRVGALLEGDQNRCLASNNRSGRTFAAA